MSQLTLWSLLPALSAAVAMSSYLHLRERTRLPGVQALQALAVLVVFWSGCLLAESAFQDISHRVLAMKLGYTALLLMPVTWIAFAICYTQRQMHLSRLSLNALCFVPVISVSLAVTNQWHHLIWRDSAPLHSIGFATLAKSFGPWYMVQFVVSAVMVTVATTILAYALAQTTQRAKPVLTVVLAPVLVSGASLFSMSPYNPQPGVDFTSLGFAAAALLVDRGLLRYGALETIPLLRDRVLEKLIEGVVVVNQAGQIIDINSAALTLLGAGRSQLSNARLEAFLDGFALDELMRPGRESLEVTLSGRTYDVTGSVLDISDPESHIVLVFRDVTTRRETERALRNAQHQLERLAHTDPLTGLHNRRYFMLRLREEIERSSRHDKCLSVLLFDLDHFKQVNDRYGHEAGDQVLQAVAIAAAKITRVSDVVARIGGEEFALLLPETHREGAMNLAGRLRGAVAAAKIRTAEGRSVSVTASVGVATVHRVPKEPREVLKLADDALYQAKRAGRNAVRCAGTG